MEMEKTVKEVSEVTGLAVEQEQAYESLAVMLIQKDQELVPYQEGESMNPMGVARVTKDTYNKMCGRKLRYLWNGVLCRDCACVSLLTSYICITQMGKLRVYLAFP